eukprot:6460782-Prymnesium_polylepis.2
MGCSREFADVAPGQVHARPAGSPKLVVKHANRNYKAAFVRAFARPVLDCVGRTDRTACPHAFRVVFACRDAGAKLAHLHLDHEQPLHQTCRQWTEQLPLQPRTWDDARAWMAEHCVMRSLVFSTIRCTDPDACAFGVDRTGAHRGISCASRSAHTVTRRSMRRGGRKRVTLKELHENTDWRFPMILSRISRELLKDEGLAK